MALSISITARKLLTKGQKATNAALNALGFSTIAISGTAETADIADDAVTPAKAEYGAWHWATVGGTANDILLTTGNSLSGTPATGEVVAFKVSSANTGAVDVQVDSYSNTNLKRKSGLELVQDDLAVGQIVEIRFDGTDWQLLTPVNNHEIIVGQDAGSTDAYAFTASPTLVAYRAGMVVKFKANTINTGACTLNISSIGAATIYKQKDVDLENGDIKAGQWVEVIYDGTNFQLTSPPNTFEAQVVVGNSRGLKITNTSVTEIDINADDIMLTDSSRRPKLVQEVDLTVDITNDGANGLDIGGTNETSSTWYYLWVISDGATTAGMLSTSATAPTMPGSYTFKALVGAIYNDSGGHLVNMRQVDRRVYLEPQSVLSAATGQTSYGSQSLSTIIPSEAVEVMGYAGGQNSTGRGIAVAADANGLGECMMNFQNAGAGAFDTYNYSGNFRVPIETAQTIYWKSIDTTASHYRMHVTGYVL